MPGCKHIVGDKLAGADKSMGDLVNQATGYLTGVLASVWSEGQALISLFSLLVITPVVAFYLICDWDRMLATVDGWMPLPQRETVRGLAREIDAAIAGFVRGQTGVCLILGSYYARRPDADGPELRPADRPHVRAHQLHSLCRLDDRARALARRRRGAVLAELDADPHRARHLSGRAVPRRLRAGAEAGRRERRPASGVADVRAARVRLSVRLRRAAGGGAAGGGDRRAGALRAAPISREPALYRSGAPAESACRAALRASSPSRSTMPRALRATIFSPALRTRRRWR